MTLEVMQLGGKSIIISDSQAVTCLDGTTDEAIKWIQKNLKNTDIKIREVAKQYQK